MFLKLTNLWILWISAFPVVSAACGEHRSLSTCLAFRRQDLCAWDVAAKRCVAARGCEARRSPRECESELTTGWDRWDGYGWALSALSLEWGMGVT